MRLSLDKERRLRDADLDLLLLLCLERDNELERDLDALLRVADLERFRLERESVSYLLDLRWEDLERRLLDLRDDSLSAAFSTLLDWLLWRAADLERLRRDLREDSLSAVFSTDVDWLLW